MYSRYFNSRGVHKTRESPPSNKKTKACQLWENIKNRCEYLPVRYESRFGKYAGSDSCKEWKDFQVFAQWFEDVKEAGYYQIGWELDKNLLYTDNQIYSPETCVFLPPEVNRILNTKSRCRGELPMGLSYNIGAGKRKKSISVVFSCKEPEFSLSKVVKVDEIEYGFSLYKAAREKYVHYLAEKYKHQLDPKAYKALKEYEVGIDD